MGSGLSIPPDPNTVRLVVTDLDGTIIGPRHHLSCATKDAVARLHALGIGVTVATGRNLWEAARLVWELGIVFPVILANGAQIYHFGEERLLYGKVFGGAVLSEFLRQFLPAKGVGVRWYSEGEWRQSCLREFVSLAPEQVQRVILVDADHTLHLTESESCPYWVFQDGNGLIELTPKEVHKGEGLRVLCSLLNLDPGQVLAVGNDLNDLELLETAGVGLAVAGCHPELQQKAWGITVPLEEQPLKKIADWLLGSTPWERIVMRR